MNLINEIRAHAKGVAKDVKAGKASAHSHAASRFMDENPDAVLGVIDLAVRAANRKKPNEVALQAYVFLFGSGLEGIRYQVERGQDWADDLVDAVREVLFVLAQGGDIPAHLLMLLLNGFIEAKLAPGNELTELMGEIAAETAVDAEPDLTEISGMFESLVQQAGGNEFDVQAAFADLSKAMPPEFRVAMMHLIAASANPVLRETAVLHLLDAAPEVRRAVCELVIEHASPETVSPVALRRMIALRNWLPGNERPNLDGAVKRCRQTRVECAAWPQRQVEEILVSNIDGAGCQSVFAVAKDGRKRVIASLLVKRGVGIADAWCMRDQSKAEVKNFIGRVQEATECRSTDPAFLDVLLPHYLAVGQNCGNVPAAGMLDFVEAIGFDNWQPSELGLDQLLSLLEPGVDSALNQPAAITDVIEDSGAWSVNFGFMDSWFEDDAEVEAVISSKAKSKIPAKVKAVIKSVLEPRRAKWAERFLWTALWLKHERDLLSPWANFFVIGREIHRGRPLKDIPVMRDIAELTVMAKISPF